MKKETRPITPGQEPISTPVAFWILTLALLWAGNSVVVKIAVKDIPPFWAAFLRFSLSMPFVVAFMLWKRSGFMLRLRELLPVFVVGLATFTQISLFNIGSQYTTGGRVTLFIFSYPLFVSLLGPLMIKAERLEKKAVFGSLAAFAGLAVALRTSVVQDGSTFFGDLLELLSSITLAFLIVLNKRLTYTLDKWKIFFWRNVSAIACFLVCCLAFESFDPGRVGADAWAALVYQILIVSVLCFLSFQYIIARHNSSAVAVFFFVTPLFGMAVGALLLNEAFDPGLLVGGALVGLGIYVVNR